MIFGCAAVVNVPVNVLADILFAPDMLPPDPVVLILPKVPLPVATTTPTVVKLPPATLPVTVKLVNVPTLVMFGWLFTVTLPA